MRILRRLTIALVTIGALVASTPAFAQTDTPANTAPLTMPTFTPLTISSHATFVPQDTRNEQGLGIFLQGGWTRSTSYGDNGLPTAGLENTFPGWLVGIGFGGNKSGKFGIGVDLNYVIRSNDQASIGTNPFFPDNVGELKLHYLDIPIYGRFNFMGHSTKSSPTLYVMFGGFVDILLQGTIGSVNIKDQFNGFDMGPLAGVGFEVARIGIEYRAMWAMRTLQSTDHGTFLNGLQESKLFTHVLLVKVRLN